MKENLARGGFVKSIDYPEERALAAAGRTHNAEELLLNLEADMV